MKYLQLASVSTPAAVSTWFQDELVNRGVDAAYTYYVLSLLKEPDGDEYDYHCAAAANANKTPHNPQSVKPERRRLLAKRCAIECLKSAADSNEEFDALVEELLARLEPTEDAEADRRRDHLQPPTTKTSSTPDNRRHSIARDRLDVDREPRTLAERAKKYFDAFPALQVDERPLQINIVQTNSTETLEDLASKQQLQLRHRHRDQRRQQQQQQQHQHHHQVVPKEQRKRKKNKRKSPSPGLTDDFQGLFKTDRTKTKDWPTGWERSPEIPKAKSDFVATVTNTRITTFRSLANINIHEADMGSVVREDPLLSRLTQKFDSKLAAIWADAPTVDDQSSLWKISLGLGGKPGGRTGADRGCDEVIFSIPNLSIFSKILEDDDETGNNDAKSQPHCATNIGTISDLILIPQIPSPPSPPALCLKNSTLNYDKDNTAFTEVIPTRKLSAANRILMGVGAFESTGHGGQLTGPGVPGQVAAAASGNVATTANNNNNNYSNNNNDCSNNNHSSSGGGGSGDDDEDLLVSPRTHFTPIRADPEPANLDDEKRPPSSSLAELTSYHLLLPEPPRRHQQQQQLHHATTAANPAIAGGATTTATATTTKASASSSSKITNSNNASVTLAGGATVKQQRSVLKQQQKLLLQQQEQNKQLQTKQAGAAKVTSSQKQTQKLQLKQQQQQLQIGSSTAGGSSVAVIGDPATAAVAPIITATTLPSAAPAAMAIPTSAGVGNNAKINDNNNNSTDQRQLQHQVQHQNHQQLQGEDELGKQQNDLSLTVVSAPASFVDHPISTGAAAAAVVGAVSSSNDHDREMISPHPAIKCGTALDNEEVQALWKMVNFTLPQAPAVDGDADVLGVAHCWQAAGPAVTSSAASKALRNEIHEEQDELFLDLMLETRTLQALQASQEAQEQRMARIHAQRMQLRREQHHGGNDKVSTSNGRNESRDLSESSESASMAGGYESSSYHDTSLEYGSLPRCEEANDVADLTCSLGYSEDSCGLPIEYLSHFSSGVTTVTPAASCLFASPETYDSAIINSVRCIQDLQRRRQRIQRKPCTFYMEGNCRRTDCKFSHELAAITCRFWEEGSCFKGLACPFLHGYAPFEEELAGQPAQTLTAGIGVPNPGSGTHSGHHHQQQQLPPHGSHHHHHHHAHNHHHYHGSSHPKKDTIGHIAKRTSRFTIGGVPNCCGGSSVQPGSPGAAIQLKGRSIKQPLAVAGASGSRVFSRRLPVFKRLWPHIKESEQDFPSLSNQKSSSHLRAVAKKNLKKTSTIVPKKAKKKKKKLSSSSSAQDAKAEAKESKDSNNNCGQQQPDNKDNRKKETAVVGTVITTATARTTESNASTSTTPPSNKNNATTTL